MKDVCFSRFAMVPQKGVGFGMALFVFGAFITVLGGATSHTIAEIEYMHKTKQDLPNGDRRSNPVFHRRS